MNVVKNSVIVLDSSFRFTPFGMTMCALREKAEVAAALWAPPLLLPLYLANCRHCV